MYKWFKLNEIQRHKFEASKKDEKKIKCNRLDVSSAFIRLTISRHCTVECEEYGFRHFSMKKEATEELVRSISQSSALFSWITFFSFHSIHASLSHTHTHFSLAVSFAVRRFASHLQTAPIFILLCLVIEFTLFSCFMLLSLHAPPATIGTGFCAMYVCVCVNRFLFADFSK